MYKQLVLLVFLFLSFDTFSQNVKKALKLYEKGDSVKVHEVLKKMDDKGDNNPGKDFIYSILYLNNFNDHARHKVLLLCINFKFSYIID